MKKLLSIVFVATMLTGCVAYYDQSEIEITYKQKGKNCVYTERGYAITYGSRTLVNNDTITYTNTSCDVIIAGELNNATNKVGLLRRRDSADVANSRRTYPMSGM